MNSEDYRRYCGSKLVYDTFRHRQRVFLQRNLRQVLDHHEHNLNIFKDQSTNSTSEPTAANMLSYDEHSRYLPSMDMLSKAMNTTQRLFKVHPKRLVKRGRNYDGANTLPNLVAKHEQSADPTWLPAPNDNRIKCNLSCTIAIDDADGSSTARVLFFRSRLANLIGVKDDKGDTIFSIDMKPFIVTENQMLTTQLANHNANGNRRWKTERLRSAVLSMSISCFNSENAFQLLSTVDPDIDPGQVVSPEQAELRASWNKLPACPVTPLRVRRYEHVSEAQSKPRRSKKLEYFLDADIAWGPIAKTSGTPLAMCNTITQIVGNKRRPQSPKPSCQPQICHITYVFDGGVIGSRSVVRTRFSCVFCPDRLPHPTFDRLHFHYLSFHDHFTFRVYTPASIDSSSVIRTVRIELSAPRYERASDNVSDEREVTWIRPETPFDLQQYLLEGGFNTWASGKQLTSKIFPKTVKPGHISKGVARHKTSPVNGQAKLTQSKRQPEVGQPEDVRDVPSRKRKRYEVPDISGVAVFRAESKREVEPGEVLSESDAEPDDSWLRVRHRVEGLPQLTGAAREFAIIFDEHMQDEPRNLANVHVCEAVVRFVRRFAVQLGQPHLLQELKNKLHEFMNRRLISQGYIDHCLALIAERGQVTLNATRERQVNGSQVVKQEPSSGASQIPPSNSQQSHNRLDVIMIDDSDAEAGAEVSPALLTSSHQTNGNDVHMQDVVHHAPITCICGKPALGLRKIIACRNINCPHTEFHMACVGLKKRIRDWQCEDCRPPKD